MFARLFRSAVIASVLLVCSNSSSAFCHNYCYCCPFQTCCFPPCYSPCVPCCSPAPCCPILFFHLQIGDGSGPVVIDPAKRLPLKVSVTNHSCCWVQYTNSDYMWKVFDEKGQPLAGGLLFTTELRTILIPPCSSVVDQPNVFVDLSSGLFITGKTYTLTLSLWCQHCCSVKFTIPPLNKAGVLGELRESGASPAHVTVKLPADSKLIVDGQLTDRTSAVREFVTPPLEAGKPYSYLMEALIEQDGKQLSLKKRVPIEPGQKITVDFDFASSDTVARTGPRAAIEETSSLVTSQKVRTRFVVSLPEKARLYVDGHSAILKPGNRELFTPELPAGELYDYTFRVEYVIDGSTKSVGRRVSFRAGEDQKLDLDPTAKAIVRR
jgi:uncharacterized protein (TIGR03000 family)